jgi:hypothetical protein
VKLVGHGKEGGDSPVWPDISEKRTMVARRRSSSARISTAVDGSCGHLLQLRAVEGVRCGGETDGNTGGGGAHRRAAMAAMLWPNLARSAGLRSLAADRRSRGGVGVSCGSSGKRKKMRTGKNGEGGGGSGGNRWLKSALRQAKGGRGPVLAWRHATVGEWGGGEGDRRARVAGSDPLPAGMGGQRGRLSKQGGEGCCHVGPGHSTGRQGSNPV